jgi:hypothetical protein
VEHSGQAGAEHFGGAAAGGDQGTDAVAGGVSGARLRRGGRGMAASQRLRAVGDGVRYAQGKGRDKILAGPRFCTRFQPPKSSISVGVVLSHEVSRVDRPSSTPW